MRPRSTTLTPSSGSMTSLRASSISSNFAGASAVAMGLRYACLLGNVSRRGFGGSREPVVALVLEAVGQLGAALLGDAAVDEDVHEVRLDVAQNARVVGDEQHTEVVRLVGAVDT